MASPQAPLSAFENDAAGTDGRLAWQYEKSDKKVDGRRLPPHAAFEHEALKSDRAAY